MEAKTKVIIGLSSLVALTTGFIVGFATWNLSRNVESNEVNRVIYELNYNDQTIKFSPLEFNSRFALTPLSDHENEHFLGWRVSGASSMTPINGETSLDALYTAAGSSFSFTSTDSNNITTKSMTLEPVYGVKTGYICINVTSSAFSGTKYKLVQKVDTFYLFNINIEVTSKVLTSFTYNGLISKKTHDGTIVAAPTSGTTTTLDVNDSTDLTQFAGTSLNLTANFE